MFLMISAVLVRDDDDYDYADSHLSIQEVTEDRIRNEWDGNDGDAILKWMRRVSNFINGESASFQFEHSPDTVYMYLPDHYHTIAKPSTAPTEWELTEGELRRWKKKNRS